MWAHSPSHQLHIGGTYMVTCGTYLKLPHLEGIERLERFQKLLFKLAEVHGWELD